MVLPGATEGTNVIDVAFTIDALESGFHYLLRHVRGTFKSHGEAIVLVFAKRRHNSAKVFALLI
jgi:hypothetical protein